MQLLSLCRAGIVTKASANAWAEVFSGFPVSKQAQSTISHGISMDMGPGTPDYTDTGDDQGKAQLYFQICFPDWGQILKLFGKTNKQTKKGANLVQWKLRCQLFPQLAAVFVHSCLFASQIYARKGLLSSTQNSLLYLFKRLWKSVWRSKKLYLWAALR